MNKQAPKFMLASGFLSAIFFAGWLLAGLMQNSTSSILHRETQFMGWLVVGLALLTSAAAKFHAIRLGQFRSLLVIAICLDAVALIVALSSATTAAVSYAIGASLLLRVLTKWSLSVQSTRVSSLSKLSKYSLWFATGCLLFVPLSGGLTRLLASYGFVFGTAAYLRNFIRTAYQVLCELETGFHTPTEAFQEFCDYSIDETTNERADTAVSILEGKEASGKTTPSTLNESSTGEVAHRRLIKALAMSFALCFFLWTAAALVRSWFPPVQGRLSAGEGLGDLKLGKTTQKTVEREVPGQNREGWTPRRGLSFEYAFDKQRETDVIRSIAIREGWTETETGLSVGSTKAELLQCLGEPYSIEKDSDKRNIYRYLSGVEFTLSESLVTEIKVMLPEEVDLN